MDLLRQLLSIPSPTGQERQKATFIFDWMMAQCTMPQVIVNSSDGFVIQGGVQTGPHIAFVGHIDVVPVWFSPYESQGNLYGAGASDMQSGLAVIMETMVALQSTHRVSFVAYNREENTPLEENGLYGLRQAVPDYFNTIDLAIVAEPTNNTIQLGCVGSIHYSVEVPGKAAHSARPWDGDHALYRALPLIQALAEQEPIQHTIMGVAFNDVMHITESQCETGRTTIPGMWKANINYRYAPVYAPNVAEQYAYDWIQNHVPEAVIHATDHAPAGHLTESNLCQQFMDATGAVVQAKQAWTDVAQFASMEIPAVNYGPGLTAQAHRPDEYVVLADIEAYARTLNQALRTI